MPALVAVRNRLLEPGVEIDETGWTTGAPAANVLTRWLRVPAVSAAPGTYEAPVVLRANLPQRYPVRYAGLYATALRQLDRWRFIGYGAPDWTEPVYDTLSWRRVMPALFRLRDLRLSDPHAFAGGLPPEDFSLWPVNIHHVLPPNIRLRSVEWRLVGDGVAPDGTPAGGIAVGHAYLADAIELRYGRGRGDRIVPTDQRSRTPAGFPTVEPGAGYRSATLPLPLLATTTADRLWDAYQYAQTHRLVVYLPETTGAGAAQAAVRRGFLGTFTGPHEQTRAYHRFARSALTLEEWNT